MPDERARETVPIHVWTHEQPPVTYKNKPRAPEARMLDPIAEIRKQMKGAALEKPLFGTIKQQPQRQPQRPAARPIPMTQRWRQRATTNRRSSRHAKAPPLLPLEPAPPAPDEPVPEPPAPLPVPAPLPLVPPLDPVPLRPEPEPLPDEPAPAPLDPLDPLRPVPLPLPLAPLVPLDPLELLPVPKVLSPANKAKGVGLRPTFSWQPIESPGIAYVVTVKSNDDNTVKWVGTTTASQITYPPFSSDDTNAGALEVGKSYSWSLSVAEAIGDVTAGSKAGPVPITPYRVRQRSARATGFSFTS